MPKKLVIIGGVAGGATAAARARRLSEDADIVMFERGAEVSFANCGLPYHIGGEIPRRRDLLVQTAAGLTERFRLDIRTRSEVTRIDREAKRVHVREVAGDRAVGAGPEAQSGSGAGSAGAAQTDRAVQSGGKPATVREYDEPYDVLLLSPGAAPLVPSVPGVQHPAIFTLRNMADMDRLKAAVDRIAGSTASGGTAGASGAVAATTGAGQAARRAIVVGGGFIGLEVAENLVRRGLHVELVELLPQVMPPLDSELAERLHQELRASGVGLHLSDGVVEFADAAGVSASGSANGGGNGATGVIAKLKSGATLAANLVVLAVGVRPDTALARDAGLTLNDRGAIVVDEHRQTSDPAIYAVGDAVQVSDAALGGPAFVPLAGPANRQARDAVDHIFGRQKHASGVLGTSIVRVFGVNAALTGASEKTLRRRGVAYRKVYVQRAQHVGYFPGAQQMLIKLLFTPDDGQAPGVPAHNNCDIREVGPASLPASAGTEARPTCDAASARHHTRGGYAPDGGRLLGAQIVGGDGVDKRIDVLATAIHGRMTVYDLEELELAYAPQFGAAKDPVNIAGNVAANLLRGDEDFAYWEELDELRAAGATLLDVREPAEFAAGHVAGALNISLRELRRRWPEVPTDKPLAIYCAVGQRAYYATRMLRQKGLKPRNFAGGFALFKLVHPNLAPGGALGTATAGNAAPAAAPKAKECCVTKDAQNSCCSPTPANAGAATIGAATAIGELPSGVTPAPTLDLRGLQCPGPLERLAEAARTSPPGATTRAIASDPGFAADVAAWCQYGGHELLRCERAGADFVAEIRFSAASGSAATAVAEQTSVGAEGAGLASAGQVAASPARAQQRDASRAAATRKTFVVFSGDLDRVMAAFVLANAAADMGDHVTLFFTFWGLNALRKDVAPPVKKDLLSRMFGWMMPRGARRLALSQMHMLGMGTRMMKHVMKSKHVDDLPTLIASAQRKGVQFIACSMSLDVMGLAREELLDGVDVAGAAGFLAEASASGVTLFI